MVAKLFRVVLIGRPNVGKSSLFNALVGYRRSIVLDFAGTTRDEVVEVLDWGEGRFQLVDCFGAAEATELKKLQPVLEKADCCLFVVDAKSGLTPTDKEIGLNLKRFEIPTLVIANKVDGKGSEGGGNFTALPFHDFVETSAVHRQGVAEVRGWIADRMRTANPEKIVGDERPTVKVALIGRPNAGKSTLMNRLCGSRISEVSPEPLTTRDPVGFDLETENGIVHLIDTAGMRRPRSEKTEVEVFSVQASTRQISAANVVFLLIDASSKVSDQDMRLLNLIERQGRPAAVLLNFWDRFKEKDRREFWDSSEFLPILKRFPTLTISGKTGFNVDRLIPLIWQMYQASSNRVPTSRLNQLVESIVTRNPPPSSGKGNFNILYSSQVKTEPPTFVLFVNRKQSLPASYQRYLCENLRQALELKGQALRIFFREARGRSKGGRSATSQRGGQSTRRLAKSQESRSGEALRKGRSRRPGRGSDSARDGFASE